MCSNRTQPASNGLIFFVQKQVSPELLDSNCNVLQLARVLLSIFKNLVHLFFTFLTSYFRTLTNKLLNSFIIFSSPFCLFLVLFPRRVAFGFIGCLFISLIFMGCSPSSARNSTKSRKGRALSNYKAFIVCLLFAKLEKFPIYSYF